MDPEKRRCFKEMIDLNKEAQQENYERIKRLNENKRQRILQEHELLKEKNKESKKISNLYQCHVR